MEEQHQWFVLLRDQLTQYWLSAGIKPFFTDFLNLVILSILVYITSWMIKFITQKFFIKTLERIIQKSENKYDDYIIDRKVLPHLAHVVPAFYIYSLTDIVFQGFPTMQIFVANGALLYILFGVLWSINASIKVLEDIYNTFPNATERPIKGYLQVLHIFIWCIGFLIAISIVFNIEITAIFAGLGAVAAVLLLIFKDTILGLVAGIQLSANKMLKIGDWINMPSHNADGTVIEITLNTVKVLNGDKTITTIPTYALVSGSFSNFKGIQETGARRIKRSINIDMTSVKFATSSLLSHLQKLKLIAPTDALPGEAIDFISKQTNLGIFMQYLENYLQNHPKLRTDMTMVVRHLQPTANGLPVEIYTYCIDVTLMEFEKVQAEIFDNILAVISEFELRVFQIPGGHDFYRILSDKN